jgi:GTP-binding protein EngB required for normal cell division
MTTANEHVSFKFLKMERRVIDRMVVINKMERRVIDLMVVINIMERRVIDHMVVINKMDNVPLTSSHQTQ